jgi:hypothetical protein
VARYDKYDPKVGGFRAPLAADYSSSDLEKIFGVGLNSSGQVVKGAGTSGIVGVLVLTKAWQAGMIVDVMTAGEIVEFGPTAGTPGTDFGAAGTKYFITNSTGAVASTGDTYAGCTVEGTRLIVRCQVSPPDVASSVTWANVTGKPAVIAAGADRAAVLAVLGTGTPSASNYLVGDGSWGTVA